ncbi:pantetheine-phosphate adenylyltransferase [Bartonella sp. DGB1]|uniref:pantetheine-phosphate adenylyltransferase n=1 Tax=Bartonella sp. DGB1 TaxID=3239807 RepID=UPI003526796E
MKKAIFAGSFDPLTRGHVDILQQALSLFDHISIGIGKNVYRKKCLFTVEERMSLINQVIDEELKDYKDSLVVFSYDKLLVEAAKEVKANFLVRGVRNTIDFEYELQVIGTNALLDSGLKTILFASSLTHRPISATLVRQIALMGGDVSAFVPNVVAQALANKFQKGSIC